MEANLTSGGEDHLIQGLAFKPPSQTANYVIETRQVLFHAESGNKFDPVSSRVIRFRLADHGFLESSSVNMAFTINNTKGQYMTPIGQTMSMFQRARLFRLAAADRRQSRAGHGGCADGQDARHKQADQQLD